MFITVKKETIFKILGVVIFVGIILFYMLVGTDTHGTEPSSTPQSSPSSLRPELPPATLAAADTTVGDLVLINKTCLLTKVHEENLVNVADKKDESYRVKDNTVQLMERIMDPLNSFLTDAKTTGGIGGLVVLSGYRTFDYQKKLYDAEIKQKGDEGGKWVAPPGGSEHHTGLVFDLAVGSKGKITKISDDESYKWIFENCKNYGFVLRYPKDKEGRTGFNSEPWHFRYVGRVHATYMTDNNLCLEEYLELLKTTSEADPLIIDGKKVYRIEAGGQGEINIPSGAEVSGDNMGGIIVTVK